MLFSSTQSDPANGSPSVAIRYCRRTNISSFAFELGTSTNRVQWDFSGNDVWPAAAPTPNPDGVAETVVIRLSETLGEGGVRPGSAGCVSPRLPPWHPSDDPIITRILQYQEPTPLTLICAFPCVRLWLQWAETKAGEDEDALPYLRPFPFR